MIILGFESSCDETATAVVRFENNQFQILSNVVASQIETHKLYGGVVPEIASRAHIEAISSITYEALSLAKITLQDVDCIAVTSHPGLIGALLIAVNFAKSLAISNQIPLVEVDHMKAHIAAGYLTLPKMLTPPFLAMAVSGGHTSIYDVQDFTIFQTIGSTRDDAIGESFDKIGRLIGIPYPAGAGFDKLAKKGFSLATGKEEDDFSLYKKSDAYKDPLFKLPSPALSGDNLDFSFSGLKTAAINLLHHFEQTNADFDKSLFAARYTYEAVEAVAKKIELALEKTGYRTLVVSGGVAANSHLRYRLGEVCKKHNATLIIPPLSLCGDNGAMVAAQGYFEYLAGNQANAALNARASDE